MSFEADYRAALLTYAPLQAAVHDATLNVDRIGVRLAQQPNYPSVYFQRVSTARLYAQTGRVNLCVARVQHDCWSADNAQALTIGDLLIRALGTFTLAAGS